MGDGEGERIMRRERHSGEDAQRKIDSEDDGVIESWKKGWCD